MEKVKKVYEVIASVAGRLAKEGIAKDRKNQMQGYSFRGIDDVYNALAPFLAEAKLCILPSVVERTVVERESKNGGALFYVTVKVDFAFVAAEDCSEHHVITYGEAMDSGDKATNKAMSAAYKYAAMQAFCIPTEGDNDADGKTHEVAPRSQPGVKSSHPESIQHVSPPFKLSKDLQELEDLGKKAFKGSQLNFLAWLGTNFLTNDMTKLSKEQVSKAKNYLTDAIVAQE